MHVLFYAESVHPFSSRFERLADYFGRISQRRCFLKTMKGARFNVFPYRAPFLHAFSDGLIDKEII